MDNKKKILILGSKGQLASHFLKIKYKNNLTIKKLAFKKFIKNKNILKDLLLSFKPDIIINFYAFTNVVECEKNIIFAIKYNAKLLEIIFKIISKINPSILFIHISTDFVFSGKKKKPYLETDNCDPINKYGLSKLMGDYVVRLYFKNFIIFRVGWIFSKSKSCFLYKILKQAKVKKTLYIKDNEYGRPTSAEFIIDTIIKFIKFKKYQTYKNQIINISQEPTVSRYSFTKKIFHYHNSKIHNKDNKIKIKKIKTFPDIVNRPKFSALSNKKIKKILNIRKANWENNLKKIMK